MNGPKAFFANMPLSKTLTMNLDVPETWLVEPVIAVYVFSIYANTVTCVHALWGTGFIFESLSFS